MIYLCFTSTERGGDNTVDSCVSLLILGVRKSGMCTYSVAVDKQLLQGIVLIFSHTQYSEFCELSNSQTKPAKV